MHQANHDNLGSMGRTVLGLLVLGFSSALFGAMVVGPRLSERLSSGGSLGSSLSSPPPLPPARTPDTTALASSLGSDASQLPSETGQAEPQLAADDAGGSSGPATAAEGSLGIPGAAEPEHPPVEAPTLAAGDDRSAPTPEPPARPEVSPPTTVVRTEPERTVKVEERSGPVESRRRDTAERANPDRSPSENPAKRVRDPAAGPSEATPPRRTARRETARPEGAPVSRVDEGPARERPSEPAVVGAATADGSKVFRVRSGRLRSREDAERLRDDLNKEKGRQAFIVRDGENYRVQLGVFSRRGNAEKVAESLKERKVETEITSPDE